MGRKGTSTVTLMAMIAIVLGAIVLMSGIGWNLMGKEKTEPFFKTDYVDKEGWGSSDGGGGIAGAKLKHLVVKVDWDEQEIFAFDIISNSVMEGKDRIGKKLAKPTIEVSEEDNDGIFSGSNDDRTFWKVKPGSVLTREINLYRFTHTTPYPPYLKEHGECLVWDDWLEEDEKELFTTPPSIARSLDDNFEAGMSGKLIQSVDTQHSWELQGEVLATKEKFVRCESFMEKDVKIEEETYHCENGEWSKETGKIHNPFRGENLAIAVGWDENKVVLFDFVGEKFLDKEDCGSGCSGKNGILYVNEVDHETPPNPINPDLEDIIFWKVPEGNILGEGESDTIYKFIGGADREKVGSAGDGDSLEGDELESDEESLYETGFSNDISFDSYGRGPRFLLKGSSGNYEWMPKGEIIYDGESFVMCGPPLTDGTRVEVSGNTYVCDEESGEWEQT